MHKTPNVTVNSLRLRASAPWRAVIACAALAFTAGVRAQQGSVEQGNLDYYGAHSTKDTAQLLVNVEKYHLGPAMEKMRSGSYFYAYQDIDFILRYFPNHPRGLALVSELCDVKWKDPRCDSTAWFNKAIAINSQASQTFLVNGVHLQRLNRLSEAADSYNRAIALDPTSGNAHYNLGLLYAEQKQYELANRHAQLAYALGMPFPGLRDKLTKAGQWKPIDPELLKREIAPPETAPAETSAK